MIQYHLAMYFTLPDFLFSYRCHPAKPIGSGRQAKCFYITNIPPAPFL